jgi:hypothetical protein
MAAVETVGRLKLPDAIPQVTSCLRRKIESLARAAATVLAEMGPGGRGALEGQVGNRDPIASRAAREALALAGAETPLVSARQPGPGMVTREATA